MPNAWVEHTRAFAKKNGLTYGCAISDPKNKESYHKQKGRNAKKTRTPEQESAGMGAEDVNVAEKPKPKPKEQELGIRPFDLVKQFMGIKTGKKWSDSLDDLTDIALFFETLDEGILYPLRNRMPENFNTVVEYTQQYAVRLDGKSYQPSWVDKARPKVETALNMLMKDWKFHMYYSKPMGGKAGIRIMPLWRGEGKIPKPAARKISFEEELRKYLNPIYLDRENIRSELRKNINDRNEERDKKKDANQKEKYQWINKYNHQDNTDFIKKAYRRLVDEVSNGKIKAVISNDLNERFKTPTALYGYFASKQRLTENPEQLVLFKKLTIEEGEKYMEKIAEKELKEKNRMEKAQKRGKQRG